MEPIRPVSSCSDDSAAERLHRKNSKGMKGDNKSTVTAGAPVFLRKTYDMINTCDREIASWFDNGTTFVVKDPDRFATEVIPKYFKHNNFSSFVRQLNFYGFRKIKSDPLRLKDAETSEESKWWKFRHEKFVQGRPEYLLQIKKHSNTSDAAIDRQEVEVLKTEVRELKAKLSSTVDEVKELKAMIHAMKKENDLKRSSVYFPMPAPKKRRTSLGEAWSSEELVPVPVSSESVPPAETSSAFVDSPSVDDEMLAYISALDAADGTMSDIFASENMPDLPVSSSVQDDEELKEQARKLEDAFAKIPQSLRALFVERLVALVSDPEEFKKQADAMTKLALAAAQDVGNGESVHDTDDSVRLGTAILGAYLSHLGSSKSAS